MDGWTGCVGMSLMSHFHSCFSEGIYQSFPQCSQTNFILTKCHKSESENIDFGHTFFNSLNKFSKVVLVNQIKFLLRGFLLYLIIFQFDVINSFHNYAFFFLIIF